MRDKCDVLTVESLSHLAGERFQVVLITGAKWKNVQDVVSTIGPEKIICFNPDHIAGDR